MLKCYIMTKFRKMRKYYYYYYYYYYYFIINIIAPSYSKVNKLFKNKIKWMPCLCYHQIKQNDLFEFNKFRKLIWIRRIDFSCYCLWVILHLTQSLQRKTILQLLTFLKQRIENWMDWWAQERSFLLIFSVSH